MQPFDARAIANYFLDKADAEGRPLTHMHLQKMLYNAHGYWLAAQDEPLFFQPVQAWKNGPVVPAVYEVFRDCGRSPITSRAMRFGPGGSLRPYEAELGADERCFLDAIWDGHKDVPAVRLSAISHMAGGPWHKVAAGKDLGIHRGLEIPNPLIRDHFKTFTKGWEAGE